MSALSIQPTFPIFTDTDGSPLENGYIWIGTVNLPAQTNPIAVYWDAALTITATQPIRTQGGYPSRNGTPARLYVNSDYSILVQNKNGSMVYSAPAATEAYGGGIINASVVVYDPAGSGAVPTTVQAKLRETVSVKDFGAVGDGVTDDTAAIQTCINATTAGQWIDGLNNTYLITSVINVTNAVFRMRNAKFVFSTSYSDQGRFELNAGSGTTAMTVELENISVDGGRGTYKVGNEPWTVFTTFAGYDSITPTLAPTFHVTAYNANTYVRVQNVNFYNVHSQCCVEVGTYGTVFIDDCEYKNISNKTFHVYHSPDNGVTQAGRTLVNNVYAQDVGMMPATFTVGGVPKVRADPYAPQGSFNFIVSHGDFTINNAIVWNYASCGVTADRNRSFNSSNVFIYHDDGNAFSNNPSGAFWLENCDVSNISNLFVWVTDRDARDTTRDSSLLQLFCTAGSRTNISNMVLATNPTTPKVNKIIRGSGKDDPTITIDNFYVSGRAATPTAAVSFYYLSNSVIGQDIRLSDGYIGSGSIQAERPRHIKIEGVTLAGQTDAGTVLFTPPGNPGVTATAVDAEVTGCQVDGSITSTVNFTGAFRVCGNKRIGGSVSSSASSGNVQVNDNAYIGGSISIVGTGASTAGMANVLNNAYIADTTIIDNCLNARVSNNNTARRIEIQDVQTFEIVGNTAKTNAAEPIIWINPGTVANILAGVISSNNVLIKTGTVGAGYVTIAGGVAGVTDVNNNKLTVNWS